MMRESAIRPRSPAQIRDCVRNFRARLASGEAEGINVRVVNVAERDAIRCQLTPIEQRVVGFTFEQVRADLRDGVFEDTALEDHPNES